MSYTWWIGIEVTLISANSLILLINAFAWRSRLWTRPRRWYVLFCIATIMLSSVVLVYNVGKVTGHW